MTQRPLPLHPPQPVAPCPGAVTIRTADYPTVNDALDAVTALTSAGWLCIGSTTTAATLCPPKPSRHVRPKGDSR